MKAALFACALALSFSHAAVAQNVTQIPQDADFQEANMRWSGATAKGYDARIAVKNMNGQLVLCGVGLVTNIQLNNAIKKSLRGGYVKLNGKAVLRDFSFFAKARSLSALERTNANCKSSGVAIPRDIESLQVRYGDGTFRN